MLFRIGCGVGAGLVGEPVGFVPSGECVGAVGDDRVDAEFHECGPLVGGVCSPDHCAHSCVVDAFDEAGVGKDVVNVWVDGPDVGGLALGDESVDVGDGEDSAPPGGGEGMQRFDGGAVEGLHDGAVADPVCVDGFEDWRAGGGVPISFEFEENFDPWVAGNECCELVEGGNALPGVGGVKPAACIELGDVGGGVVGDVAGAGGGRIELCRG